MGSVSAKGVLLFFSDVRKEEKRRVECFDI